jgi:zinc transport system substrate-binding protein
MRKTNLFLAVVVFFCAGIFAPSSLPAREPGKPLKVVCTILPIYILTLNVIGQIPGVQVKLLLPPQQGCPHDYDLTPGDLIKLSQADLIIANGLGMEEFLERILKQPNPKTRVLLAAEKVEAIQNQSDRMRLHLQGKKAATDHHHESAVNGHAWVSPKTAALMTRTIAHGLAQHDPVHASEFHFNAERYSKKMEALAQEMTDWVSRARNKNCLAFHDIFAYLARDIGLNLIGVIESHPGIEPSPKDMVRLIGMLRERRVAAIFSEPQYSDKVVKVLSRESGVPFFELDPVATGKPVADTYEKAMRKNLEILHRAIK